MLDALTFDAIRTGLAAIIAPNTVFEIRCLASRRKRVDAGYFNSIDAAASELSGMTEPYQGIYLTPNPVKPDLLARAMNRIKPWAENQTYDTDIVRRLWLLIDVDPDRPTGISSTNLEHNKAINKARTIAGMLDVEFGWCTPMLNSSGNGAHLMYPINEPNDEAIRDLIQAFLKSLAGKFNEPGIKVDTSVFNAARIWRLPGTYACKGDSTVERPHRLATILQQADEFGTVTAEQLAEYVRKYPAPDGAAARTGTPKAALEHTTVDKLYHFLNSHAMEHLDAWVPVYFPGARTYQQGYRVSSFELGRDKEEDLTIHPWPRGIKDFGVHDEGDNREGRRTPTMLIAEHHHAGDQEAAAKALSATLKVPVSEFPEIVLPEANGSGIAAQGYKEIFGDAASFDLKQIKSFGDLKTRKFKNLKWLVPDVLPTGCFILAARPKMRKTWLALQMAVAVSTGGTFMQWRVNKGEVLGLMLEDNERRLKSRIDTLHTFDMDIPDLGGFHYFTEGTFPRGQDGVEVIKRWLDDHPSATLVIIDTFAHFRAYDNNRDVYLKDYAAVMPLTRLAAERDVCILVVHHEKKGLAGTQSGDFLEDVNGSSGITGGVDGIISIKGRRGVQDETESRKLLITGRDVPHDYELDMSFDAERGGWLPAARQDVRVALVSLLTQHPFITATEFKALLPNTPPARINRVLIDLKYDGLVDQNRYGYSLKRNV